MNEHFKKIDEYLTNRLKHHRRTKTETKDYFRVCFNNEFSEYDLFIEVFENIILSCSGVGIGQIEKFSFIVPEKIEDLETILNILNPII